MYILHPPHGDYASGVFLVAVPDFLVPTDVFVAVENNEVAFADIAAMINIPYGLFQSFGDDLIQVAVLDFQFEYDRCTGPP